MLTLFIGTKPLNWRILFARLMAVFIVSGCQTMNADTGKAEIPLFDNLGNYHYQVTGAKPLAQKYFDQGLILAFGFNHAEAARSFRQAYTLDPGCALCYWGEALVLGPNINAPMDPAAAPNAYALVQQALAHAGSATTKEQALIRALSKRYAPTAPEDRAPLDEAYAEAMRDVARNYTDDALILALTAEALMDLDPWDFWTKPGKAQPWAEEIVTTLEQALELAADHPLANHLYIHAMEASPFAEKALPSAKRLESLVPGSGHLVHMPAHIYIRIGHYRDAILSNQQAVKVDNGYLSHHHTESLYTLAYVPHNHHFLWAAAIKTGRKTLAEQAAADTAARVNRDLLRDPGITGTLQHFLALPLYTKALFGEWNALLNEPKPPADLKYLTGVYHYARSLALIRTDQIKKAKAELENLELIMADPSIAKLTIFDLNPVATLLQIGADHLYAELSVKNNNLDDAVSYLQHAVKLEDGLNYTEPKDWYLPPRQVLGAILLDAGKAEAAEKAYLQDLAYHPQNGWSLYGLMQSLRAQGKNLEAAKIQRQFEQVWSEADVRLTRSIM